jgi:coenzyme Q-binding protein COQ10
LPAFRSQRPVAHSREEMFSLVADVEQYPDFLPLCESLRIIKREQNAQGQEVLIASMGVGYKAIKETFVTRVTLDKANLTILVEYIDGPFKNLHNSWSFIEQDRGCLVDFSIDYEFRNFAFGLLMGAMFDRAFRKFSEAFEKRADKIYGSYS